MKGAQLCYGIKFQSGPPLVFTIIVTKRHTAHSSAIADVRGKKRNGHYPIGNAKINYI